MDEMIPRREIIALNLMRWQCDAGEGDWPEDKCLDLLTYFDKPHSGDCTKMPWTCLRCCAEDVYKQADDLDRTLSGEPKYTAEDLEAAKKRAAELCAAIPVE